MTEFNYSTYIDGEYINIPTIDKLCLVLKEKFNKQEEVNAKLIEENKKLKEGIWEKEEIKRLKESFQNCNEELKYGFGITKEEHNKILEWIKSRKTIYTGAISGRYEYRFFPTGIGEVGKIIDTLNGDEFIFRELD